MLLQDLSYAMRQLRRAPGFAFIVVLRLADSVGRRVNCAGSSADDCGLPGDADSGFSRRIQ
jgi:hypothetical protein